MDEVVDDLTPHGNETGRKFVGLGSALRTKGASLGHMIQAESR